MLFDPTTIKNLTLANRFVRSATCDWMADARGHVWIPFWENLREGYDYFERRGVPPDVRALARRYVFAEAAPFRME